MTDVSTFLDGASPDKELEKAAKTDYVCTQLSLTAMAQSEYVVMNGIDSIENQFTDAQVAAILATFNTIVDESKGVSAAKLREKLSVELGKLWAPCSNDGNCPFDLHMGARTRIIFHVHIPNWAFDDAMMKIKTSRSEGSFSNLQWLELDKKSQKPMSFSIQDNFTEMKTYEFGLFMNVTQTNSTLKTLIIIDPSAKNSSKGPP